MLQRIEDLIKEEVNLEGLELVNYMIKEYGVNHGEGGIAMSSGASGCANGGAGGGGCACAQGAPANYKGYETKDTI